MVAPQVATPSKSLATSAIAAELLMLDLPGHLPFADQAAVPIKGGVAVAAAESFTLIADRSRQLAAAFRVAATVP